MATKNQSLAVNQANVTQPWLGLLIFIGTQFVALPFLAPVFMSLGWERPARAIYFIFGFLCHQMAQRSFFLFGPTGFQMYNLADLPIAPDVLASNTILATRAFIGTPDMGWKVAWSDRMVYMYGATLLMMMVYALMRKRVRIKPLSLWAFALLLLPMAIDGGTHMLSDLAGIGQGFRYTNQWLAAIAGNTLPVTFYAGDALGSFNSWMRLFSGLTFGLGVGGLLLPWIDMTMPANSESA